LERDKEITDRYTVSEDKLSPGVYMKHPNRNTGKGGNGNNPKSDKTKEEKFTEATSGTAPEELHGIITKDSFLQIATFEAPVCVSIFLPTHRAGVEVNEQHDRIVFKNALQKIEKDLDKKYGDETLIKDLLAPGYNLLRNDPFWY